MDYLIENGITITRNDMVIKPKDLKPESWKDKIPGNFKDFLRKVI